MSDEEYKEVVTLLEATADLWDGVKERLALA